jgi:hypothetical protein
MTNEQENNLYESFKTFTTLYNSTITYTDEKVYKLSPMSYNLNHPIPVEDMIESDCEDVINIKMPKSEYTRFMSHWGNYIDIMRVCKDNPLLLAEFEKVVILTNLMK